MPTLRWTGDNLFSDLARSGRMLRPGDEIDVDESEVPHYLEHRTGCDWEVVKGAEETETEDDADSETEDEPDSEDEAEAGAADADGDDDEDAGADEGADDEDDADADLIDPAEYTIADLEPELESIDDVETLETVRELEQAGKDRAGAVGAIDDRLDAVREG